MYSKLGKLFTVKRGAFVCYQNYGNAKYGEHFVQDRDDCVGVDGSDHFDNWVATSEHTCQQLQVGFASQKWAIEISVGVCHSRGLLAAHTSLMVLTVLTGVLTWQDKQFLKMDPTFWSMLGNHTFDLRIVLVLMIPLCASLGSWITVCLRDTGMTILVPRSVMSSECFEWTFSMSYHVACVMCCFWCGHWPAAGLDLNVFPLLSWIWLLFVARCAMKLTFYCYLHCFCVLACPQLEGVMGYVVSRVFCTFSLFNTNI